MKLQKNYPPLKLRVFVDDITALLKGRNKELAELVEEVLNKLKKEVEEKGLRLSITEGCREGKNKVIASCEYLEEKLRECSKREGEVWEKFNLSEKNYMKIRVRKVLRTGLVSARAWGGQAVGMAPTKRLKLRRQMAEGSCMGKWSREQDDGWRKQIFEVQTWRQARGPGGAAMRETCDLGIKWPRWHTLIFEGQENLDMRLVCPQDVKKMLPNLARTTCRKKWATRHEYEELKDGVWFDPIKATLREKMNEEWTNRHRIVFRKIVVEGTWVQKRLYDIGWSDEKKCPGCNIEEGTEKHRLCHCPCWNEIRNQIPEESWKWEQRARTSKKFWKWQ